MLKLILLLFGGAAGAAGATAWLVSEPGSPHVPTIPTDSESLQARLADLQVRLREALAEGDRAGRETEERLRRDLEAYRRGARPAAS
jgi:hypothetical protein